MWPLRTVQVSQVAETGVEGLEAEVPETVVAYAQQRDVYGRNRAGKVKAAREEATADQLIGVTLGFRQIEGLKPHPFC